ncbi:MAG: sulfotransferase [Thermomicrobiales bacterium]
MPSLPVAIVGMHRSGTSMVAKVLQEAGLHLGSEADLMPPAAENPAGFFEHLDFVRLNDEVLNAAGAGWDCPPPPGVDWGAGLFTPFRERARLLAEPLAPTGAWGWKDPRTSLTLPFWRSALGPLRTIVVVRNPLEVVTSLHRRNGFSIALGLTLWQIYSERMLAETSPDGRLVTHYDAYFFDPEKEIARLLTFLNLERDRDLEALRAAAVPDLRHHRKTLHDLDEGGFPAEAIALYRRLCAEADWIEDPGEPDNEGQPSRAGGAGNRPSIARGLGRVDLMRAEHEALRRNNEDFRTALAEREARIRDLEAALTLHEATREEIEGRLAERDGRVAERDARINRRDHTLGALQRQLTQAVSELSRLREQVAELTERLAESERSREIAAIHEGELRSMLTGMQAVQLGRDAEIMGTLGAVLSRHAPGAPAAIYHRRLLDQVQRFVEAHVPTGSRTLVATYGDSAMLHLGDRATEPFPRSAPGLVADYTDVNGEEAVTQLEALRDDGAEFLVVPSPALPWLASHPEFERHLEQQCTPVARERGIGAIYGLNRQQAQRQIPA